MKTIRKVRLLSAPRFAIDLPEGAEFLSLRELDRGGGPDSWWAVDSEAPLKRREFCACTTGEFPDGRHYRFLGTVPFEQLPGTPLTDIHLFEVIS